MRTRIPQKASGQGSVAVEYALILPVLLLFILGIGDMGRMLWTYATLSHAVDAASRCGAISGPGCGSPAQTADYAVSQAYGLNIDASAFTISAPSCGYQVESSFVFTFTIPWLGSSPFGSSNATTITATACYPT